MSAESDVLLVRQVLRKFDNEAHSIIGQGEMFRAAMEAMARLELLAARGEQFEALGKVLRETLAR